jgi:threonyl-tRNA synthetase
MIHRAPFGSMERFIAVLLEHCAGNFPLWLATDQFSILPISEKVNEYAKDVLKVLKNSDIRGFVDNRNETAGKKIRDAEKSKVPYMLIVGEKEASSNQVSVRKHGGEDLGVMDVNSFADLLKDVIKNEMNPQIEEKLNC